MLSRRSLLGAPAGLLTAFAQRKTTERPNVLLITVDDMNWNSPGAFGGKVPGITPNIDRLASQGMRFEFGHVTVAVCQPSRSCLMTGRYPHRNGAEGFGSIRNDVPTLQERLHEAGYLLGIFAKTAHLAPREKFHWDVFVTPEELGQGRDPQLYYQSAQAFLARAKKENRPFFLMANSQDPHRPFAGSDQELKNFGKHLPYSRKIEESEIQLPGFLPDLPDVQKEIAEYFTSVHRADQTVGRVLQALDESGLASNTLVMFLSDNGMALPFAKTNCYLNSTKTPWIVRWPGKVKPGSVDRRHFISGIDFTPTILEACGLAPLDGLDGTSFLPLLSGRTQPQRDHIFTVFHETSARKRFEMRCLQTRQYGYIFNGWADGKTEFRNESMNGRTYQAMRKAAPNSPAVAARLQLYLYRTPEELYDFAADPNGLHNLAGDPRHKATLEAMRRRMYEHLVRVQDPVAQQLKALL